MNTILVVSDLDVLRNQIRSILESSENQIIELQSGRLVRQVAENTDIDLAIIDSQIGSMGGFAVVLDLHLEEYDNRILQIPALILLDRRADAWMARQTSAEGFLLKPINPIKLKQAVKALLNNNTYYDSTDSPISAINTYKSAKSLPGLAGTPL